MACALQLGVASGCWRINSVVVKALISTHRKTQLLSSLRELPFLQSQYLKALASSLRVGFCNEWKKRHSIANTSNFTQQCNVVPYCYAVYWLPPASSAFSFAKKCN